MEPGQKELMKTFIKKILDFEMKLQGSQLESFKKSRAVIWNMQRKEILEAWKAKKA